jgi:hypothetical protein
MAKARSSGGGIAMNKNVKVGVRTGAGSKAISPGAADALGQATAFNKPPLVKGQGERHSTIFGNERGPGKGRTVHRSGSQGHH